MEGHRAKYLDGGDDMGEEEEEEEDDTLTNEKISVHRLE